MGKRKDRKRGKRDGMVELLLMPPPAQVHSATSVAAAESVKEQTPAMRARVLDWLKVRPMTDEELCNALHGPPNSIRPRRIELVKAGIVTDFGKRPTASGRLATVWGVVDHTYSRGPA